MDGVGRANHEISLGEERSSSFAVKVTERDRFVELAKTIIISPINQDDCERVNIEGLKKITLQNSDKRDFFATLAQFWHDRRDDTLVTALGDHFVTTKEELLDLVDVFGIENVHFEQHSLLCSPEESFTLAQKELPKKGWGLIKRLHGFNITPQQRLFLLESWLITQAHKEWRIPISLKALAFLVGSGGEEKRKLLSLLITMGHLPLLYNGDLIDFFQDSDQRWAIFSHRLSLSGELEDHLFLLEQTR